MRRRGVLGEERRGVDGVSKIGKLSHTHGCAIATDKTKNEVKQIINPPPKPLRKVALLITTQHFYTPAFFSAATVANQPISSDEYGHISNQIRVNLYNL